MAGCSSDLLARAGLYADRLSANIELPTQKDLDDLAPAKTQQDIEGSMATIGECISEASEISVLQVCPGLGKARKMIVGATASPDRVILQTASQLYQKHKLRGFIIRHLVQYRIVMRDYRHRRHRIIREHRLYQADWLLRFYGFKADELVSEKQPNLDLSCDPKTTWALQHQEFFPVDVNTAEKWQLLRVPGLGHKTVDKIIAARRFQALELAHFGEVASAARCGKTLHHGKRFKPKLVAIVTLRVVYNS